MPDIPPITRRALLAGLVLLPACAADIPDNSLPAQRAQAAALTDEILALGPGIDPAEATRAADLAYSYTAQLARQYEIVDPPLVHNTKVNMGIKSRGLCWHWAEDMERRLKAEGFQTLAMHRAIASADNPFRIDHSTAIVSRAGDGMYDGIVLDPWRYGGVLHWDRTIEDIRYDWQPRTEVLEMKARARAARNARATRLQR